MADTGWKYRPELDGIRAVAVTAVVVFHARPDWLPGGFLGVDAFFVLSGFLITGLLLAERDRTGRVRLAAFWGRRARRLLPALLLLLLVVAFVGRRTLAGEELPGLRMDALAALGYLANWRMIYRGGDYFAQAAAASPLQHTWSLGIEEQFYLLWPLLLVALLSRTRRVGPVLTALALLGTLASLAASALLYTPGDVNRAYYGTDTRAAALLVGCALAAAGTSRAVHRRTRRLLAGAAALAALGLVVALVRADGADAWLYRGGLVAVAVAVGAVLAHLNTAPHGVAARALSLPPLVWIGQLSYGVYLWHWPLIRWLSADRTGLTGVGLFALRVTAAMAAATLSFYLLERPIQRGFGVAARRAPIAAATTLTVAGAFCLTAGVVLAATAVSPRGTRAAAVAAAPSAPAVRPSAGTSAAAPARPAPISRAGRRPGPLPRVTILGDSVAWTIGAYLPEHPELAVSNRAIQGCGIARLPDIRYLDAPHTNYPGCDTWDGRWRHDVAADDPDVAVILLDRWELMDRRLDGRYQHLGDPQYDAYLTGELTTAIDIAGSTGAVVVLLTAPYTHRDERPDGSLYPEDTPPRVDAWNSLLRSVAARHPAAPVLLDLNRVACPAGRFTWNIDDLRIRSDGLHFTPGGVQQLVAPWLLPQLRQLATQPRTPG